MRETALVQLGLTKIGKSPLNIINYTLVTAGMVLGLTLVRDISFGAKGVLALGALTACNTVFIFLYSFAYSCRVISEEKQFKTMILLRLTPVNEKNIFWGKILPPFINLLQILVFQLPVMILAFTLGGISLGQVFKVYLLIILSSSCLTAMSAWVSAGNPENWLSHFNYIFFLIGLMILFGVIQLFNLDPNTSFIPQYVNQMNPVSCSFYVISLPSQSILPAIIGSTIFILACLKFGYRSFIKNIDFDEIVPEAPKNLTVKRTVDFSKYPLTQKEFHFGIGGKKAQLIICGAFTIIGTFLYFMFKSNWYSYSSKPAPLSQTLALCLMTLSLLVIYYSGNSLNKEKSDNTWNDLILCPFKPSQIINQKIIGALKFTAPMVIIILVIALCNYPQTLKDLKAMYNLYRFTYIIPAYLIFALVAYIYFQLFEKSPSSLTLYLLVGIIAVVAFFDNYFKGSNGFIFIGAGWTIFLLLAFVFYRKAIKAIENYSSD